MKSSPAILYLPSYAKIMFRHGVDESTDVQVISRIQTENIREPQEASFMILSQLHWVDWHHHLVWRTWRHCFDICFNLELDRVWMAFMGPCWLLCWRLCETRETEEWQRAVSLLSLMFFLRYCEHSIRNKSNYGTALYISTDGGKKTPWQTRTFEAIYWNFL